MAISSTLENLTMKYPLYTDVMLWTVILFSGYTWLFYRSAPIICANQLDQVAAILYQENRD
jgi:hypothetical protein